MRCEAYRHTVQADTPLLRGGLPAGAAASGASLLALRVERQGAQKVVPPARPTRLDHVCRVVPGDGSTRNSTKLVQLTRLGDATPVARKSRTEHVGHEHHGVLDADRTLHLRHVPKVACRPQQLGVCVADLVATKPSTPILVDQCATSEAMVDDATELVPVVVGERQRAQPPLRPSHEPTR